MRPFALLVPTSRALPWAALAGGGGLGLAMVAVPVVLSLDMDAGVGIVLLRIAALSGALGVAFILDDPSRHTLDVLPVRRQARQALRVALVLPPVAAWWAAVLALGHAGAGGEALPLGALTLEAAALMALALAMAGTAVRLTGTTAPGLAVGGALLAIFVVALALPARISLFVPLEHERWDGTHRVWAAVLALALLAWAACAREPAGRLRARAGGPPEQEDHDCRPDLVNR